MEETIAVDNHPILFEQSLYTYRDNTLLATTGSFCNNNKQEEGSFYLSGEQFDWQQAVSTKTTHPSSSVD